MDNSRLSEQINKKYASLKRHEANVERLRNKEPFTEFDNKKLHREKYGNYIHVVQDRVKEKS